ncbi:MAG: phosphatidate cytidylyltransferase [Clostridia bacterium]|nr:phosphatidate cytidylyltransferase [Clostridia bacterium]
MKQRVLTSIGIGIVGIPVILFSKYIVYPLFLGLLSAIGVWELLRVFGIQKRLEISIPAYLISGLLPVFAHSFFTHGDTKGYILIVSAVLFAFLLYLAAVCVFGKEILMRKSENKGSEGKQRILEFGDIAAVFLSVTYVTVSFTSMSLTRYMTNGVYIFGLVFIAAWMCDIFAYFTGRLFGRHKLAPHLSPKKTIEGSIGGVLFASVGCILYGVIIEAATDLNASYLVLALIGLILSVVSQIGDLFASLIKREHGVKDYSQMLPGHGGVMDRFDSILAIATVLMAVCMLFPPFA